MDIYYTSSIFVGSFEIGKRTSRVSFNASSSIRRFNPFKFEHGIGLALTSISYGFKL
jgi:hypothetical protein